MIGRVDFVEGQISPGESRTLRAWTDAEPLFVAIQCFREPPNPPALTACAECGNYRVQSGEEVGITASSLFESAPGYLHVTLRDASGDTKEYTLTVVKRDEEEKTQSYA